MKKIKKGSSRLLAVLLTVMMLFGMFPAGSLTALAAEGTTFPFTLTYTVNGGEEKTADASEIGTIAYQGNTGTVYLVSLPYGAEMNEKSISSTALRTAYITSVPGWGSWANVAENSLEDMAMLYPSETDGGYKTMMDCVTLRDESAVSTKDVKGFGVVFQNFYPDRTVDFVIVQISTKEQTADSDVSAPWDGSTDTSWYNTEDTAFTLTTAEQLAGFAAISRGEAEGIDGTDFAGITITLGADILLNDDANWQSWDNTTEGLNEWSPIAINRYRFAGTFDGAGHVIRGLYINTDQEFQGLFGFLDVGGIIQNITLESGYLYSTNNIIGGIVGYADGDVPGTAEEDYPLIENCGNRATVVSNAAASMINIGGIAGTVKKVNVRSCFNSGTVSYLGEKNVRIGGIFGNSNGFNTVENCYNTGAVKTMNAGNSRYGIGGIAGMVSEDKVYNCYSVGVIEAPNYTATTKGLLLGRSNPLGQDGTDLLNGYYLSDSEIPAIGNKSVDEVGTLAVALTEAEMKAASARLGDAFAADSGGINGGYPILVWQVKEDAVTPWDGSIDTSWYNTTDTAFTLTTAEQLAGFAAISRGEAEGIDGTDFAGITITLGADIQLNDDTGWQSWDNTTEGLNEWSPIAINRYRFAGTFDGAGHVIRGLYIHQENHTDKNGTNNDPYGLFGYVGVGAHIRNVTVESGYIYSTGSNVAGIAGYVSADVGGVAEEDYPVLENCGNRSTIVNAATVTDTRNVVMLRVGGIAGSAKMAVIRNCFNSGKISHIGAEVTMANIGGITSGAQGWLTVENCYNTGDLTATGYSTTEYNYSVGGLVGYVNNSELLYNSYNAGKITLTGGQTNADVGLLTAVAITLGQDNSDLQNCYYLSGGDIPDIGYTESMVTDEHAVALTEAEMKAAAARLGDAFAADNSGINGGYPILAWQNKADHSVFTVKDLSGNTYEVTQMTGMPEEWSSGVTMPIDYCDGVYSVTVPKDTEELQISLGNLKNVPEGADPKDYATFALLYDLAGYISGDMWHPTCGYIDDMWEYSLATELPTIEGLNIQDYFRKPRMADGAYVLPLADFRLDTADAAKEDFKGALLRSMNVDSDGDYALLYLGTYTKDCDDYTGAGVPLFSALLLVRMSGEQAVNTVPRRDETIPAQETKETNAAGSFTQDLSGVFVDAQNDPLTYYIAHSSDLSDAQKIDGTTYTCTLPAGARRQYLVFTASDDGGKTFGSTYTVVLELGLEAAIAKGDTIRTEGGYYTENDTWNGEIHNSRGFYASFTEALGKAKDVQADANATVSQRIAARNTLLDAAERLIPLTKLNASLLYQALNSANKIDLSLQTETSQVGYEALREEARELFDDGKVLELPVTEENQAHIEDVAERLQAATERLVNAESYQSYYDTYRSRKDEAKALLELYNPANYTQTDYTADSWQTFVNAYNTLKADLEYRIEGEGGTKADYDMVRNFVTHINNLQNAYNNLVSDQDITVSFSYINNFAALYPQLRQNGTDVYSNDGLELKKGATTLYSAIQAAGLTFDTNTISRHVAGTGRVLEDGRDVWLMVYVNGVNYGFVKQYDLAGGRTIVQLHDKDEVKLIRVPIPIVSEEASSGYDTTTIFYYLRTDIDLVKDSLAMISIDSLPGDVRVGDRAAFTASVKGGYATNLNQALSAANLSLYVSGPSETEAFSQNLTKTNAVTDADGKLSYIFTEPGWYTVALLNAAEESYTFTNVFGETTYGTYGSLYAGDFTLVYVAPAEDEAALIAAQRTENLQAAKNYFRQYHEYDFAAGRYESFKGFYTDLLNHQNSAKTFKELMDSFNQDYAALADFVADYALDHDAMIQGIRDYLRYIPQDVSGLDYTYANIVSAIQSRYQALNDYQKNLLTAGETARIEAVMKLDAKNLYQPDSVTITIQKDENVTLPVTHGNLASAPNENCVYIVLPDGTLSRTYYQFTTSGMLNNGSMEPSCAGMTAYPGNQIHFRRIIKQSEECYWLAYSLDGENWQLMELVNGGAFSPEIMLQGDFILPETEGGALTVFYKAISKAEYEEMKLHADSPEMALEAAKTAYKAALEAIFQSYDSSLYTEDDFIDIRDAKNNGLANIEKAKEVSFALRALNAAIEAMEAVPTKNQVHVVVRNDTFTKEEGAPWDGVLVDTWVDIDETSSMMSAIRQALESKGYSGKGFDSGYISDIEGLGEFGGGSGSGWMGTLNDWFTNEGFAQFTVANGKLKAGDFICVEYTCALGEDIRGGVQGSDDTSLYSLTLSNGTLTPVFDKGTVRYLFTLNKGANSTQLGFSASNRGFQVRAYRNEYDPSALSWIASGDTIHVQNGDVLYIGVGESAWPSMGSAEATVYTIVVVDGEGAAKTLIEELPIPDVLTYADKADVDRANAFYQALTDEQKVALGKELEKKLLACVERMAALEQAQKVAELLETLPEKDQLVLADRTRVEAAKAAYDAMTAGQKDIPLYLTERLSDDAAKIQQLILEKVKADALTELDAYADPAEYSGDHLAALQKAIADGKAAIEAAGDVEEVGTALKDAKAAVDNIPTDEALAAAALAKAKEEAKAELDGYRNASDYRDEQKDALASIIADGKAAIEACASREDVRKMLGDFKAKLDRIPTDAQLAAKEKLQAAIQAELDKHLETLLENVPDPIVNTNKGEWSVMDMARAGYPVPKDYFEKYYAELVRTLKECDGLLHSTKYTEYSRVILALSAIGYDPSDVGGYNLLAMLTDMEKVSKQGINGPIWALIALDTRNYEIVQNADAKEQVTREKLIQAILDAEIEGGGWALSGSKPDADITGMALQALAPYKDQDDVKPYIDRALAVLSEMQDEDGGFSSWGTRNSESTVQVIVALTALGIDPKTDSRFVKANGDPVTALLTYALENGGFKHVADGEYNDMATDQGIYGLIAYSRFLNGENSLYDMMDVTSIPNPDQEAEAAILAQAKDEAKAALDGYKDPSDYREAQKAELVKAIANGKAAIDAATDIAGVNAAAAAAKAVIDGIKTDADLTAEEEEVEAAALSKAKADAKAVLDGYKNAADYREAQKAELAKAIADGKAAIDKATDIAGVNAAVVAAKTAMDGIKTDAQLTAEEEKPNPPQTGEAFPYAMLFIGIAALGTLCITGKKQKIAQGR